MPKVGIALGAEQLYTAPAKAVINALGNFCCIQFAVKARPATTGMKLAARTKQQVPTADTLIVTLVKLVAVLAAERCFGAGFAGYVKLFSIQLFPPLLRVFAYFLHGDRYCNVSCILRRQADFRETVMIKVFEDFDITLVGYYQSVLEANEIQTFMKNQFGTGGLGDLPFVEVIPQLWVLNDAEVPRAIAMIEALQDDQISNEVNDPPPATP